MLDIPICLYCKHFRRSPTATALTCDAFPAGIPVEIIEGRLDHRKPVAGDQGRRFEAVDPDGERYARDYFLQTAGD